MISLAITTYNRYEMTIESFSKVIDDERIGDIVILDDASTDGSYERLRDYFEGNEKVRVIRQVKNRGMSLNKKDAIGLAKYAWVLIFDSDNILDVNYLDALFAEPFYLTNVIYLPDGAMPQFPYQEFSGLFFDKKNVKKYLPVKYFEQALNTCNFFVHGPTYSRIYEENKSVLEVDTLWFNYLWLKAGYGFKFVKGMEYFHRVHEGSGWLRNPGLNIAKAEEIKKLIKDL